MTVRVVRAARRPEVPVLAAFTAAALALRLLGIGFGLPLLYHPDEPAFVLQALAVGRGLPNGLTFANPPLLRYLLLGEFGIEYLAGLAAGVYRSPQDFVDAFRADPSLLYLTGRVTSALLGALTPLAAFGLARRVAGARVVDPCKGAAILAAGLTAAAFLLVRESHFAVSEALVTLMATLALSFCLRMYQEGRRRDYVLAGAAMGLAFTAKYTGAVVLLPFLLAHLLRRERERRSLAMGLGAAALTILLTFPSLVLEPSRVLHDIYLRLYLPGQVGYDGMDPTGGYIYYLRVLEWGLGGPLVLAAVGGVGLALARRRPELLIVAAVPVALYAVMGQERMFFARFLLPGIPSLLVLAAAATERGVEWITTRTHLPPRLLWVGAVLLLVAPTLLDSLRLDGLLLQTDTRTLAKAWIEAQVPAGARITAEDFPMGPQLTPGRYDLRVAPGSALYDRSLEAFRAEGIEYMVTSSFVHDQWVRDPAREARREPFQAALKKLAAEGRLVAEFRPSANAALPFVYDQIYGPWNDLDQMVRPGPIIQVYHLATQAGSP